MFYKKTIDVVQMGYGVKENPKVAYKVTVRDQLMPRMNTHCGYG